MHVYGTRDLARLLGISASSVRSLIRAGHVRPRKGARGKLQFSFQDLIVLRTARSLSGARVPTRRLNRCLRQLRNALPTSVPLSGLSITAIGDQIAVREGKQHWDTESGQYLLALEVVLHGGEVQLISRGAAGSPEMATAPGATAGLEAAAPPGGAVVTGVPVGTVTADELYDTAYELEATNPPGAIEAYERCLVANKDHADARLNCGRLLHLVGRMAEAERVYRASADPDATLLFNLAVLLEDLGRQAEAMQAYRDALLLDPALADAHFNLARLHELAGNRRESFRHLLAYKRASS
jgi:tetratricopeptide (TPR) repeat protein